jgi:hypothetical protein
MVSLEQRNQRLRLVGGHVGDGYMRRMSVRPGKRIKLGGNLQELSDSDPNHGQGQRGPQIGQKRSLKCCQILVTAWTVHRVDFWRRA